MNRAEELFKQRQDARELSGDITNYSLPTYESSTVLNICKYAFSGAILSKLFTDPITRSNMQYEQSLVLKKDKILGYATYKRVREVYKKEGFIAFYRNFPANAIRFGVMQSFVFTCKEKLRSSKLARALPNKFTRNFLSGALAGIVPSFLLSPFEAVELIRMQTEYKSHSFGSICKMIAKNKDVRGFYPCYSLTGASAFLFRGLTFGIYDTFIFDEFNVVETFLLSYFLTSCCYVLVSPLELVVQRTFHKSSGFVYKVSQGQVISEIWNKEGIKGFYKNMGRLWTNSLTISCLLWSFDVMQRNGLDKKRSLWNIHWYKS